jgi:hypothetical protein
MRGQDPTDAPKHRIAGPMAIGVSHGFESVDISDH